MGFKYNMILLKTIIFSLLVPGTVVGGVPYLLITRGPKLPAIGIDGLRWIGIAPFLGGLLLFLSSARNFVLQGKGTPAPIDPPVLLVTSGPYRFVRNPMYVGGILILLGESVLCRSFLLLIYLGMIWLAFHLFIVFYEEPHLRRVFGTEYEEYYKQVRRWVPRVRKVAMP
jgi:protein-S-isoprenylcysteine O-methyltransferase Ste14